MRVYETAERVVPRTNPRLTVPGVSCILARMTKRCRLHPADFKAHSHCATIEDFERLAIEGNLRHIERQSQLAPAFHSQAFCEHGVYVGVAQAVVAANCCLHGKERCYD